jgi:hypothetical protein
MGLDIEKAYTGVGADPSHGVVFHVVAIAIRVDAGAADEHGPVAIVAECGGFLEHLFPCRRGECNEQVPASGPDCVGLEGGVERHGLDTVCLKFGEDAGASCTAPDGFACLDPVERPSPSEPAAPEDSPIKDFVHIRSHILRLN